jgi:mono/diheme cytochrome c family protein
MKNQEMRRRIAANFSPMTSSRALIQLVFPATIGLGLAQAAAPEGKEIYARHCAECHGENGEGSVEDGIDPLVGDRTLLALSRYIDRQMPEEDPALVTGDDARKVAAYIMDAFYGPEARARQLPPPKKAFARLTNRQFRESVADLIGSFGVVHPVGEGTGLRAEYFQSDGMNKKARKGFDRLDSVLDFDFGEGSPGDGISADQFSIAWDGSLLARATGWHEFRITTPNGARLYLNGEAQDGDNNHRDDSAARRQVALIDAWVSSGDTAREESARAFLLAGRSYPLRLDYFKYQEARGSVRLEWKLPNAQWAVLSAPDISPAPASRVTVVSADLPPDDGSEGYERGTAVSKAWHEATTAAAIDAANQIVARLNRLSRTRESDDNRIEGLKTFLATLAERAFRRPLDDALRQQYVERLFTPDVTPDEAVKRSAIMILKSPRFLYPEIGAEMDSFTVASRLALGVWDSIPDQALLDAAKADALRTPEQVREQVQRMMADPRAKAKLAVFFQRWLKLDAEGDLLKDPEHFPDFTPEIVADLRRSLELFVEGIVWSEASDYRELLQSDAIPMNERLAEFYGVELPEGDGFRLVKMDPVKRAGVITHPYVLSRLAHHDGTSPIHRGVFLTRNVLGGFLKPPPQAIAFDDHGFDPEMTMREKVTKMTSDRSCMTCHDTINPLGFSLENFDAVGRFRTLEINNKPIDPTSEFLTFEGELIHFSGPRDVADHAADSTAARRGFVRQLFQSVIKQSPAVYGHDTLDRLDQDFVASGYHIRNLFTELNVLAALHGRGDNATASQ